MPDPKVGDVDATLGGPVAGAWGAGRRRGDLPQRASGASMELPSRKRRRKQEAGRNIQTLSDYDYDYTMSEHLNVIQYIEYIVHFIV